MGKPTRFDGLLHDLCVGLGFCGCVSDEGEARDVTRLIPASGEVTAEQFADWVIQADWPRGYDDPEFAAFRQKWLKTIAQRFVKHMGRTPSMLPH